MCFEKVRKVHDVEKPDVVESIKIYRNNTYNPTDYEVFADLSCTSLVTVGMANAALEAAENFPVKYLSPGDKVNLSWDRMIVICDTLGFRLLDKRCIHPDQVQVINTVKLAGKILVFQLKDFCHIAQYSLDWEPKDKYPENEDIGLLATLKIGFNYDNEQGIVYQFGQ